MRGKREKLVVILAIGLPALCVLLFLVSMPIAQVNKFRIGIPDGYEGGYGFEFNYSHIEGFDVHFYIAKDYEIMEYDYSHNPLVRLVGRMEWSWYGWKECSQSHGVLREYLKDIRLLSTGESIKPEFNAEVKEHGRLWQLERDRKREILSSERVLFTGVVSAIIHEGEWSTIYMEESSETFRVKGNLVLGIGKEYTVITNGHCELQYLRVWN